MNPIQTFIPISKVDEELRMVWGYASTSALDAQGERVARKAIEDALPDYMRFANVREMHGMSAVGVAKSAEVDDTGLFLGVKVVDDSAWAKVKEGVYKGFSIGGKTLKGGYDAITKTITKMRLTEISLVDRPANPECVFDTFKADGMAAGVNDMTDEELATEIAKAATTEAPAAATEADAPAFASVTVTKGLWNLRTLLDALGNLHSVCTSAAYEAREGQHTPEMVAELKVALTGLGEIAQKYLGEEVANMLAPKTVTLAAGEGDDIAKAGKRFSKVTKESLAKVHGMLRDCDKAMSDMAYDGEDEPEARKADGDAPADIFSADDDVKKAAISAGLEAADGSQLIDLAKAAFFELVKAKERVKELEAQPEPAKAALTGVPVAKSDDTNDNELAGDGGPKVDPNNPLTVFKAQLSRPMVMGH